MNLKIKYNTPSCTKFISWYSSCLVILSLMIGSPVYAQLKPYYSQYQLNQFLMNPALSGIENYVDVKAGFKKQWEGIVGAPVTQYVSVHTPIGKTDSRITPTSFFVRGENPDENPYREDNTPASTHHGLGLLMMNDKAGYLSRWSATATYAYHTPLTTFTTLSAGFSAGVTGVSADRSKVVFAGLDPIDPALGFSYDELNKKHVELGAGLWLYHPEYYAGLSVMNITTGKNKYGPGGGSPYSPNYIATLGGRMLLAENFSLLPSVMFQYCKPQLSCLNLTGKLQYKDVLWVGGNYRYSNLVGGYAAYAGVNISNAFQLSYAYEMASSSELQKYTQASHELVLGIIFGNNYPNIFNRNTY